jgi:hypothetical protein
MCGAPTSDVGAEDIAGASGFEEGTSKPEKEGNKWVRSTRSQGLDGVAGSTVKPKSAGDRLGCPHKSTLTEGKRGFDSIGEGTTNDRKQHRGSKSRRRDARRLDGR